MKSGYRIVITLNLLFLISCSLQKQKTINKQLTPLIKENYEYDKDFLKFIEAKWDKKSFEKDDLPKFDFLKSFYEQLEINNESILSDKFLSKPSNNNLLTHYLNIKLKWNSFNYGGPKQTTKEVTSEELENPPSENEMLVFYYKTIFIHILNNQRSISPYDINIDFQELALNETESAILFLSAMKHLGNQVTSYAEAGNCDRTIEFVEKIPKFNGMTFDNFELPEFEDFKLTVNKRDPKMSFKERYIHEFEKAKIEYQKCVEIENKN